MNWSMKKKNFFLILIFCSGLLGSIYSINVSIDEECLNCICMANTGCQQLNNCFEDSSGEIRCGMFLLKQSHWDTVLKSSLNLRKNNISSFDKCYKDFNCASDLINSFVILKTIDENSKNLTCLDVTFYSQFGKKEANNELEKQYLKVLKTHQCMNNNLPKFNSMIKDIKKENLIKSFDDSKEKTFNITLVPRRCFDCIQKANNYNSQSIENRCLYPQKKCGPYAINFEYFLKANGNLVVKIVLPKVYNQTSELENQNLLLDTLDLLNKVSSNENKQLRKEDANVEFYKEDYNKKLMDLLDENNDQYFKSKTIFYGKSSLRKNSKLLTKFYDNNLKSRRNSKFSRDLHETNSAKSITLNEETSIKKLIYTATFNNFANCATDMKCSESLINVYVKQHLDDCNFDSLIDCDDFASIHWLGNKCKQNTMLYSNLWKNFEYCSILADDVRKEPLFIDNSNSTTNNEEKNFYEITNHDLPSFQVRPNTQVINNSSDNSLNPDVNQYYSSHVVDLSSDCLQCICEASTDQYNCSQIVNPTPSSSFYVSSYKMSFDNFLGPPPPQVVYQKINNRMPKVMKIFKKNEFLGYKKKKELDKFDSKEFSDESLKNCNGNKLGCGPFSLTKLHFLESMINTFWYRGAAGDWERCAESLDCSIETVSKFVTRFSMDCTKDGRLSCADFGLIYKFKDKCADLNVLNTEYYRKFEKCIFRLGLH